MSSQPRFKTCIYGALSGAEKRILLLNSGLVNPGPVGTPPPPSLRVELGLKTSADDSALGAVPTPAQTSRQRAASFHKHPTLNPFSQQRSNSARPPSTQSVSAPPVSKKSEHTPVPPVDGWSKRLAANYGKAETDFLTTNIGRNVHETY